MEFKPQISPDLKEMDARIFSPEKMGYAHDLQKKPRLNLPKRLQEVHKWKKKTLLKNNLKPKPSRLSVLFLKSC